MLSSASASKQECPGAETDGRTTQSSSRSSRSSLAVPMAGTLRDPQGTRRIPRPSTGVMSSPAAASKRPQRVRSQPKIIYNPGARTRPRAIAVHVLCIPTVFRTRGRVSSPPMHGQLNCATLVRICFQVWKVQVQRFPRGRQPQRRRHRYLQPLFQSRQCAYQ